MSRRSPFEVRLSVADRAMLEARASSRIVAQAEVVRARIVLLAADDGRNVEIARRLHGLIERIPHTHRYRPTALGWRIAVYFTHSTRFLHAGLAELADPASSTALRNELDRLARRSGLAA